MSEYRTGPSFSRSEMEDSRIAAWNPSVILVVFFLAVGLMDGQTPKQIPTDTSPGESIQDAARAAAHDRATDRALEVLTNTQGVDFGPYSQSLISTIRRHWYVPESARVRKGRVVVEFTILKNGEVADMKLVDASGDAALDRAAWQGVSNSRPFPALPAAFGGDRVKFRFRFYYNEIPGDRFVHAVLIQKTADDHTPEYPASSRAGKINGAVRLEATVRTDGKIDEVRVLEGDAALAEASTNAIKKWRFYPAQRNLVPVEELVRIRVEFRNGEQVKAQVVWPKPGTVKLLDRER